MIITNKAELPDSIVNIVKKQIGDRPREDRIRTTELIHAPLTKRLLIDNWDKIEVDVCEYFSPVLGTAVHSILEDATGPEILSEYEMIVPIPGTDKHLKGTMDRYDPVENRIEDYKIVSVWSLVFGIQDGMKDYQAQANVYRWMFNRLTGKDPQGLRLIALLRDWNQRDAEKKKDYPALPFQYVDLPVWSYEETTAYINERLKVHNSPPVECTDEEKWKRPSLWAIKVKGQPRAKFASNPNTGENITSEKEARMIISTQKLDKDFESGKIVIEERPSEAVKCTRYCPARTVCPYADQSKVVRFQLNKNNVNEVKNESK